MRTHFILVLFCCLWTIHSLAEITGPLQSSYFQVVDAFGSPIENAKVTIGMGPGVPFKQNIALSDQHGRIQIPLQWRTELPLTISAYGYLLTTYHNIGPLQLISLEVQNTKPSEQIEVSGITNGYGRLRVDGKVDFALVMHGLSRKDLLQFDFSNLVSPRVDAIQVAGKTIWLPSNIALPEQTEKFVVPIKFNKPEFRTTVDKTGVHSFIAVHGRFPIRDVSLRLREGKSVLDIVNLFNFKSGTHKLIKITSERNFTEFKLDQFKLTNRAIVHAPKQLPQNTKMISVSMIEKNDVLLPTDIKIVSSGTSEELKIPANTDPKFILSLLLPYEISKDGARFENYNVNQLSSVIEPNGSHSPEFLSLIPSPQIIDDEILVTPPQRPEQVREVGTLFVLSEITKIKIGKIKTIKRTRLWQIFSKNWIDKMKIPDIAVKMDPGKKYQWQVMFLGSSYKQNISNTGALDVKKITHITHSKLDL